MCFSSPAEWSEGRHREEPCHWQCSCHHSHQRHHTHSELVAIATLPCVVGIQFIPISSTTCEAVVIDLILCSWPYIALCRALLPSSTRCVSLVSILCCWCPLPHIHVAILPCSKGRDSSLTLTVCMRWTRQH